MSAVAPELVAEGLPFGEGPALCADGSLVGTGVQEGVVWIVRPGARTGEVLADVRGGPNSVVVAEDGGYAVAQNGGIDLVSLGFLAAGPDVRFTRPGLQRVAPDGAVSYLTDEPLQMPNDIIVAPDGTLFVTDPESYPPSGEPRSRIIAFDPDGGWRVWADNFLFCNGIAQLPGGDMVVTEGRGLMRVHGPATDERAWITKRVGAGKGDGLAIDVEGNCYVACQEEGCVRAFDPHGNELAVFAVPALHPGRAFVTDCIFAGADRRTLLVFDALQGKIMAWEGMPHPGLPVYAAVL